MKKRSIAALFSLLALCLAGCSATGVSGTDNEDAEEMTEDMSENIFNLDEGVIVTYCFADEDASEEDINNTVLNVTRRIKKYTDHCDYAVNGNQITFGISLDPEKYDMNELVTEIGRSGELLIFDEKNYDAWYMGGSYEAALTGADVVKADGILADDGTVRNYIVQLELTEEGAEKFAEFTTANIGKTTYIIFNDEVVSDPKVFDTVPGGRIVITGLDTQEDAESLAADIMAGALPLKLDLVEYEIIEAEEEE